MAVQLSPILRISLVEDEYEKTFHVEFKECVLKFYLKHNSIISKYLDVGHTVGHDEMKTLEMLVDGSLYHYLRKIEDYNTVKIMYFMSIISYVFICQHLDAKYLYHQSFKNCLYYFIYLSPETFKYISKWPLVYLSDNDQLSHEEKTFFNYIHLNYTDYISKYTKILDLQHNKYFENNLEDLKFFYYNIVLTFCERTSKRYICTDIIDSFLFGVFLQNNPNFDVKYAPFNRHYIILKEIFMLKYNGKLNIYETRLYDSMIQLIINYFDSLKVNIINFIDFIRSDCNYLDMKYNNGMIMAILDLNVFAHLLQYDSDRRSHFLKILFQASIDNQGIFDYHNWKNTYHLKIKEFLKNDNFNFKPAPPHHKYDGNTILNVKSKLFEYINNNPISEELKQNLAFVFESSHNEIQLIDRVFKLSELEYKYEENDFLHIQTIFLSLIIYFKDILFNKLCNSYKSCITKYRTHQNWSNIIYNLNNYHDPCYDLYIKDFLNNMHQLHNLENDLSSSGNYHLLFQLHIYCYIFIQEIYYFFMNYFSFIIDNNYKFRLIELDQDEINMPYSIHVNLLSVEIETNNQKLKKKKAKKYSMNLHDLLNNNFDNYLHFKKPPTSPRKITLFYKNSKLKQEVKRISK